VGEAGQLLQEAEVKSTIVKPSNGRVNEKQRSQSKHKSWSVGLRRLTKKQKQKIYRGIVWVFLVIFTVSIVGGLIALTVHK
jgi:hypothetical protein